MADTALFGARLKEARLRAGYTQMQLGVAAGIDEYSASARINQYERGKHWPDFGTAERLAAVLGVPAAFFYARDDALAAWILRFENGTDETKPPESEDPARS
ncbi:MAG: helix-turn-helix domain-containing protein [Candidatus Accumulibacter sp.]|jgi:transcriptional regulator with XRE-family HTH domain|nr:helix-turn-helix domain-containing protein [Accumulibacter sp.]